MIKPVDFPEANFTFQAPDGMPDCGTMRAFVHNGGIVHCWEFSEKDIEILQNTKRVWVSLISTSQPPMSLSVEMPFVPVMDLPEVIGDDTDLSEA